jgi:hypothetical protein
MDRPPAHPTAAEDLPSKEFELDGVRWILRVTGWSSVRSALHRDGKVVHLTFFRAEAPSEPRFEILEPGVVLEALSEIQAMDLLRRAREARPTEGSGLDAASGRRKGSRTSRDTS